MRKIFYKQHPSVIISYNNQVTSGLYSVENFVPGTAVLAQTLEVSPEIEVNDLVIQYPVVPRSF